MAVSEMKDGVTFLAQQYPEEIAALKSDETRQWHSWGNGSQDGEGNFQHVKWSGFEPDQGR